GVAGELERDAARDRAVAELELGGLRAGDDVNLDGDVRVRAEVGLLDVHGLDGIGIDPGRDVVEAAVGPVQAGERRGVRDPGDGLDGAVDLELFGADLVGGEGAGVGGLHDE